MKDAYYFSHDSNSRTDVKLVALRRLYGWAGYGLWWALIETMREEPGYHLQHERIADLAYEWRADNLQAIVDTCCELGLFECVDGYMVAPSLVRRMGAWEEKREKLRHSGRIGGMTRVRNQRESAAKLLGSHTKAQWLEMVAFFDSRCVMCGAEVADGPTKDHIKPIYQGGSDSITNIQPVCRQCNSAKGAEAVDYRPEFCKQVSKQMPSKWLANAQARRREEKRLEESKGDIGVGLAPSPAEKTTGIPYEAILKYLNDKAETAFMPSSKATQQLIKDRWKEGFRGKDFAVVIQKMTAKWGKDDKMRQYLRPSTLFRKSHFEEYLNG